MNICCPQCKFERNLNKVPDHVYMATCPHCNHRFQFRDNPKENAEDELETINTNAIEPTSIKTAPLESTTLENDSEKNVENFEDDPLPPNAVIKDKSEPSQNTSKLDVKTPPAQKHSQSQENSAENQFRNQATEKNMSNSHEESEIPWEMPQKYNVLNGLYQTILQVLFSAPQFFAAVGKSKASLFRAAIFYLIMGTLQSISERLWLRASFETLTSLDETSINTFSTAMSQDMSIPAMMLTLPPMLFMQLILYTALFSLMIRLVQPEQASFSVVLRVIAYSSAPAILSVIPVVGQFATSLWFAVCCFVGCKYALNLSWPKTATAITPLYILAIIISYHFVRMLLSMKGA